MKKILLFITFSFSLLSLSAEIVLPGLVGNNMVLQQQTDVNLWGKADAGKKVTLQTSWDKKVYTFRASSGGDWQVSVRTPVAGGPYSITVSDGKPMVLSNILIGEVWLCSGQSNMEMPMKGFTGQPVDGALDAVAQAVPENNIRMVTVSRKFGKETVPDCETTSWQESTPGSVAACSATGYYFARYLTRVLRVPVGLIISSWGGSKIQAWMDKEVLKQYPGVSLDALTLDDKDIKNPHHQPSLLYNTMMYPLKNYTIRGAIWYQGESNRNQVSLYKKLFPALVESWRKERNQGEFPFYYVQIAPFSYDNREDTDVADFRRMQEECLSLIPNSGMAVTADIGHPTCIHPAQKDKVGQRLALLALAGTYGRSDTPCSGPVFKSAKADGSRILVDFNYTEMGLTSYGQDITGFEIAGSDQVFYPAKAVIERGNEKIALMSPSVEHPVSIRYAYRNYISVNLYNTYNLPVAPFKADVSMGY